MVRKQHGRLLRMSHDTVVFVHTQITENNLSDVCGHTSRDERKVNHVAEQGLDRQAASVSSLR